MSDEIEAVSAPLPALDVEGLRAQLSAIQSAAVKWQGSDAVRRKPQDWPALRDMMAVLAGPLSVDLGDEEPILTLVDFGPGSLLDPAFTFDPASNADFVVRLAADLSALSTAVGDLPAT